MTLLDVRHQKGISRQSSYHWFWCALFGPLYFAHMGVIRHAIASVLLLPLTLGLSWLVYPIFARRIVRAHLLKEGWQDISRFR